MNSRVEGTVNLSPLAFTEAEFWRPITRDWRQLYGGFYDSGISVEWHDFTAKEELNWAQSFHPASVELCLNVAGHATVESPQNDLVFEPLTAGFYLAGRSGLRACRRAAERHQFVTVEFSGDFLQRELAGCDGALHPLIEKALQPNLGATGVSKLQRLTTVHQQLIAHLLHPPVFQAGRKLWLQAKVLELMAEFFFERTGDDELFCDRQKRIARQRVDRAIAILRERLAEPPLLDELGRRVGCSPFYLSRIFSKEMGMTIPQFLRRIRMERAAELLASGKCNVTEAAMEVGYSSLSHFSQAFCQTIGCCPNLYSLPRAPVSAESPKPGEAGRHREEETSERTR